MTRHEAVVLSYLEWLRLINTGGIRLDEHRIARWKPDFAAPSDIVAELMCGAPDVGTSANDFVLAVLEPEVLDRISSNGIYLGRRLPIEMVKSFHSFSEKACVLHHHDAVKAGMAIDTTPLAAGWANWVKSSEDAERRSCGMALLDLMNVPLNDRYSEAAQWVVSQENRIDYEKIVRWRDTMSYGWACVLNSYNARPRVELKPPEEVKNELRAIQKDLDVEQPFLANAPRLCDFVLKFDDEGEIPTNFLALAALKQHERYVVKRDGAALDLDGLFADVAFLEDLDIGSAALFIQTLGERLPSELIRALKANGVRRLMALPEVPVVVDANSGPELHPAEDVGITDVTDIYGPVQEPTEGRQEKSTVDTMPTFGAVDTASEPKAEPQARVPDDENGGKAYKKEKNTSKQSARKESHVEQPTLPLGGEQFEGTSSKKLPRKKEKVADSGTVTKERNTPARAKNSKAVSGSSKSETRKMGTKPQP